MYFDSQNEFINRMVDCGWYTVSHVPDLNKLPSNEAIIGAVADLTWSDGSITKLLLLFVHVNSPRSYVEGAWKRGDILRLPGHMSPSKDNRLFSLPTRDIRRISWEYLVGPINMLPEGINIKDMWCRLDHNFNPFDR